MLELQLAMLADDQGIVENLIDMSDKHKDFLVTSAMKGGDSDIKLAVVEAMICDHLLADALDSAMFGADDKAIVNDIRNNLYSACEQLIQDAIDEHNEQARERDDSWHGTKDSDFA